MTDKQSLAIFVGSPRKKGTSYSFARTIKKLAEDHGNTAEIVYIIDYFDNKEDISNVREIIDRNDIIGCIMPLYVDFLPAPVIWFMEQIADRFHTGLSGKRMFAVSQCGFPDSSLMEPSLESCRLFAVSNEMKWMGGIGYGGGALINGTLVEDLGKKGATITRGFDMVLQDIYNDKPIREEAQKLLTTSIPKILYRPVAWYLNYKSRQGAKRFGLKKLSGPVPLD